MERLAGSGDPRVVVDGIEAPERAQHLCDCGLHIALLRNIAREPQMPAAEPSGGCFGFPGGARNQRDTRPFR